MESYQSQDITELAKALLAVQSQLQPALKDAKNPFTKSSYATLNSVMETCRAALLANGILLTQFPVPAAIGHLGLATKLIHAESGQWHSSLAVIPLPKADPQGMGSALTYARRYALVAMLGMVTEDDDGESAKIPPKMVERSKSSVSRCQTKKRALDRETQGEKFSEALKSPPETFENLPRLEGVEYQRVNAQDGRECIVATGDTRTRSEILTGAGFRWNVQRKCWWKYAAA